MAVINSWWPAGYTDQGATGHRTRIDYIVAPRGLLDVVKSCSTSALLLGPTELFDNTDGILKTGLAVSISLSSMTCLGLPGNLKLESVILCELPDSKLSAITLSYTLLFGKTLNVKEQSNVLF